jgi:hypothetical protein
MDDAPAHRAYFGKRAHFRHHVMAYFLFNLQRACQANFIGVRLDVRQLLRADHPYPMLCFRQRHPDPAPR